MDIYCVVTGQNEFGKSVIVRNTPIKPVTLSFFPATSFIACGEAIPSLNFRRTGLHHRRIAIFSDKRYASRRGFETRALTDGRSATSPASLQFGTHGSARGTAGFFQLVPKLFAQAVLSFPVGPPFSPGGKRLRS
jgi:hypothetical protein